MEELIARNKSRLLLEDFKESFQRLRSGTVKWMLCLLGVAVIAASLLLYYYQGLLEAPSFWPFFGMAAGGLILLGDFVFSPWIIGRMWFIKSQERFGQQKTEELVLRFSVWDNRIEASAKHAKTVPYFWKDLKKLVQTEHLLILLFSDGCPLVMLTDSFTQGGAASVLDASGCQ